MNWKSIFKVSGKLLVLESALLLIPAGVSVCYGEADWKSFLISACAAGITGFILKHIFRTTPPAIRAREGFFLTIASWLLFGLFGCFPFIMTTYPLSFTDAYFEIISGLTTTGATMFADVEVLPHGILFWRALSQWVGGLGIILFLLAVLPELNRSAGMPMFNAESTGITHDKLHPRIRQTAISLWMVYSLLTLLTILALWMGPISFFDSVCQTMSTVATGGFSTHNAGIDYWKSDYIYAVITIAMFFAGVNFMLVYKCFQSSPKKLFQNYIFRCYIAIVAVSFFLILFSLLIQEKSSTSHEMFIYPLFLVLSAITTTGFGVPGYEHWGATTFIILILIMTCGASAGSTTGGMKVDRIAAMWKNIVNELKKTAFPKRTFVVKLDGSWLQASHFTRISAFVSIYILILGVSTLIATLFGYSVEDSLFMMASAIGDNGLGFGATGEQGGYFMLPSALKWLMIALMVIGRLELFTFLVLLLPSFWRK